MSARSSVAPWRNRIIGSGTEDPTQLLANPRNWRTHPASQRDALRGSLEAVGWVQQVIVNRRTGHLVDGHARVEEAISRGEPAIPVLYVDLEPEEEAVVLATLDPLGAMAMADPVNLAALLAELAPPRVGRTDPDEVPAAPAEPYVQPGDMWQLGEHRLLCGDATTRADIDRLMAGTTATVMFTDPPWNVAIGQDSNPHHRQRPGMANDDLAPVVFQALLDGFAAEARRVVTGDLYVILGASEWPTLDLALRKAGNHWSATIIWAKDAFVLGRSN